MQIKEVLRVQRLVKFSCGVILLVAVALLGNVMGGPALVHAAEVEKTIITYGEAEVAVTPDQAHLTFGVEAEAATAREALRVNAAKMDQVINSLKNQGLSAEAIRTSGFSLHPRYEYIREGERDVRRLVGYRVNNNVSVQTSNLENLGQLIDTTVTAGANVVQGITFTVENTAEMEQQALAQAVRHARSKAQALAQAAGTSITAIVSLEEISSSSFEPLRLEKMVAADSAAPTPIEPGQIQLTNRVKATFSIH
jgi:uncharacterized protein YggE